MTYPAGYTMHTGQKDIESLIKNLVHKLTSYDESRVCWPLPSLYNPDYGPRLLIKPTLS